MCLHQRPGKSSLELCSMNCKLAVMLWRWTADSSVASTVCVAGRGLLEHMPANVCSNICTTSAPATRPVMLHHRSMDCLPARLCAQPQPLQAYSLDKTRVNPITCSDPATTGMIMAKQCSGTSPAASGCAQQPLAWSTPLAEALRGQPSSARQEAQHSGVPALHLAAAVKPECDS